MEHKYSIEKNVQLIVALMKAHGIKRVVASPGSTNICLSHSLQNDPFFEMYSSVDERSAAYIACGLATETGEAVALTCTEATASRNYMSGLTEAYYRHLPILCITATNDTTLIGQNHPQMIDRTITPKDIVYKSLFVPEISSAKKELGYTNLINDAMLELFRHGGGPVHIEYETGYHTDYSVDKLPCVNVTHRIHPNSVFPPLDKGKIAIYVGAHRRWKKELISAVESFCEMYDAVVLCDHISNYPGKYGVYYTLLTSQTNKDFPCAQIDTCIYIGDISSAYAKNIRIRNVWRIHPDGELRNVLHKYGGNLEYVFEMEEDIFFRHYADVEKKKGTGDYLLQWHNALNGLQMQIPELPFSNLWVAKETTPRLPKGCHLYLGIENTLRTWNFFPTSPDIEGYSNTGGFGIDGGVSSLIGASFANADKLYFGVTGDLAFFYDMNVLGNRHVGKNIRLIVINNAIGQQFKNPKHPASFCGGLEDEFVAAAGHFGNKSHSLLRHYAEDLGFEYFAANDKEEFLQKIDHFCLDKYTSKSMILEVFTNTADETEALRMISELETSASAEIRNVAKNILGDKGRSIVRKFFK